MNRTICDRCGKDVTAGSWEDGFGELTINFNKSSNNKLIGLKRAVGNGQTVAYAMRDLCYNCQQKIQDVLFNALNEIEQGGSE